MIIVFYLMGIEALAFAFNSQLRFALVKKTQNT